VLNGGVVYNEGKYEEKRKEKNMKLKMFGEGWKEKLEEKKEKNDYNKKKNIVVKVYGKDEGYGLKCKIIIMEEVKVLRESEKMNGRGGV
jgi:hypothetical protein